MLDCLIFLSRNSLLIKNKLELMDIKNWFYRVCAISKLSSNHILATGIGTESYIIRSLSEMILEKK
jgi:hypothetical protein